MDAQSALAILDGHLLCAFVAFSEQRSFAGAARAIGLSQPALFERIARLARIVDLTLYERNGRTLTLTPHGDRLLAFAREELARAARFAGDDDAVDEVALAAGEGTYLYLLGPALARFTRAHQRQKLRALTLGLDDAVAALRDGTAHLAVAAVDVVPRGIDGIELVRSPLVVAVKKSHPWAHKRAISLAQLAREDLVLPPEGRSHRDVVGRALARRGLSLRTAAEADGWPLLLKLVEVGLGVAVVNSICALPSTLRAVRVPELGAISYRLLWRRSASLSPAAQALAKEIRAAAR